MRAIRADNPDETINIGDVETTREQFALDNPKISIWLGAMSVLVLLHLQKETAAIRRDRERAIIEDSIRRTPPAPDPMIVAGVVAGDGASTE